MAVLHRTLHKCSNVNEPITLVSERKMKCDFSLTVNAIDPDGTTVTYALT